MTLVAEVDAAGFEAVASGERRMLLGRIERLVVRQGDGLLEEERQVSLIEPVGSFAEKRLGLPVGGGPAIRVFLRGKEQQDG